MQLFQKLASIAYIHFLYLLPINVSEHRKQPTRNKAIELRIILRGFGVVIARYFKNTI